MLKKLMNKIFGTKKPKAIKAAIPVFEPVIKLEEPKPSVEKAKKTAPVKKAVASSDAASKKPGRPKGAAKKPTSNTAAKTKSNTNK